MALLPAYFSQIAHKGAYKVVLLKWLDSSYILNDIAETKRPVR